MFLKSQTWKRCDFLCERLDPLHVSFWCRLLGNFLLKGEQSDWRRQQHMKSGNMWVEFGRQYEAQQFFSDSSCWQEFFHLSEGVRRGVLGRKQAQKQFSGSHAKTWAPLMSVHRFPHVCSVHGHSSLSHARHEQNVDLGLVLGESAWKHTFHRCR